jgi:crotonobetainyl-CoA:carnitine CoA-transferase CaiB-like acyl-CoA transferase
VEVCVTEGALEGTLVVELCQNVAGPYAGLLLGELGARVVKVERPGAGDDTRSWGPPFWGDESAMFLAMNAGKESIALDLSDDADRAVLEAIIDRADVVVQSFRPGRLARLGFSYEHVRDRNPDIVYCSISGFGDRGPLAQLPGYDPLIQAFAGLMAVTGEGGAPPVRVGTSIIDMGTGMWSALAIVAALRERDRRGRGTHISTSLLETGVAWLPYQLAGYLASGNEPQKMGSGLPMLVPYQAFPTADGHVVVAAGNDGLWHRLCGALERPDLAADPDLATNPQRVANRERVVEELSRTLSTRSSAVWVATLRADGVPCSPVHSVGEVVDEPQVAALGLLSPVADGRIPQLRLTGMPFSFDGDRPAPKRSSPALDEHGKRLRTEFRPSADRTAGGP